MQVQRLQELERIIKHVLLVEDEGIVQMMTAAAIANRMSMDPVWLMIVASSGAGKSEFIGLTNDLDYMHPISDLTTNTFASGLRLKGEETSLLKKVENGVMTFKDFTSILSKHSDERRNIMGQMREIYDGSYTKRTGNGEDIEWNGRVGAIAGSTEIVYKYLEDMSAMGDRFIMYDIRQPDRKEIVWRALENTHDMAQKRERMKKAFAAYVMHVLNNLDIDDITLSKETKEKIVDVADLTSRVRSGLSKSDRTGKIDFIPSQEVGTRITKQLVTLATAFIAMHRAEPNNEGHPAYEGKLTEKEERILYKTAFTSIPRTRRDVLVLLAQYERGAETRGLSEEINLESSVITDYCRELAALEIAKRTSGPGENNVWHIDESIRDLVLHLEGKEAKDERLKGKSVMGIGSEGFDTGTMQQYEDMAEKEDLDDEDDIDFDVGIIE